MASELQALNATYDQLKAVVPLHAVPAFSASTLYASERAYNHFLTYLAL